MKIKAQCVISTGYSTSSYDPETGDCETEDWAYVTDFRVNKDWWVNKYGEGLDDDCLRLAYELDLPRTFDEFVVTIYTDGTFDIKSVSDD